MSQENVEVVQEAFLATRGGDPVAPRRFFDSSIEWDMSAVAGWTEQRMYRGREVGEFLQAWADSWDDWHFDVEDVRAAGQDQVFVAIHEWGIGGESGASVEQRRYFVIGLRGARIARVKMFSDSAEALEAAGLRE
jgi:ketosteroid isomerase-like protein